MKFIILTLILISISKYANAQSASDYYTTGVEFLKQNKLQEAKYNFNKLIELAPEDYGGYNFYGICLFSEANYDSCVPYLKKSIELNLLNHRHSKEMTISRLIRTYIYLAKFSDAFELAYKSSKEYVDNPNIKAELKDVCLWSYFISHEGLSKEYLSNNLNPSYDVTAVSQEYLIMRNIKVNDKNLFFKSQSFNIAKKQDYLICGINKTQDSVRLTFNLKWDLFNEFGGKYYDSKKIYNDKSKPVYERIGALLKEDEKLDLIKEIERLEN